ncbi:hypothetical protein AtubIFM56815_009450 [Aspergillus tubingensis]|uniref:Uncharacterized protein n=2 Tax=Aspergillus subgen. Circumdati TaxID=2720871 RepID=A0A8H3SMT9_ASPTU|nr:similar to An12g04880 [Aspergillus tubingensis]GAQ44955.1 similar to An12g04880 [Aspergillus niger]GFN11909.1 similar to An12g04880 [Aspergillus tubingensis]GLA58801.1 hypothetical protein AtubIFM54640_008908 [Aspergillus tubingensis]GLA85219.1 hypothetical protein AtubIFM56815_009450 [Aspergillus tubingensis]GLB00051.1 hypothetical protein AtubIFM57143_008751 [Aspergillus tubingensis]
MAFRLPPQVPRRRPSYSNSLPSPAPDITSPLSLLPENEATEWVLFSPTQQPSTTARTHTTSTDRTPRTQGISRLSDFGSFGTATRSAIGPESEDVGDALDEPLDDDGTELDSLDDGLHAFRAPSLVQEDQGAPAVLPAHDGLGSFQASSQAVQNQLWQHEQYNPNRRPDLQPRRRSSVQRQLDMVGNEEEADMERERWQRIEKWRMEQSRVLLQEIEKATRRRRDSRASGITDPVASYPTVSDVPDAVLETPKESESASTAKEEEDGDESLLQRITRKVIRDLIGIDDSLLSVIFGESLPSTEDDEPISAREYASNIEALNQELDSVPEDHPIWQSKVLQRIAHELGILVNQLCEHPGAFTTYLNMSHEIPNQYAGIPLDRVPEEADAPSASVGPTNLESTMNAESVLSPHFSPTLGDPSSREHAAQWGIEDDDIVNRSASHSAAEPLADSARAQQEKEYWERELDIRMVFRYLRNRFTHRGSNNDTYHSTPRRAPQDASRRAAIIRQHHPLVARAHSRSQAQIRRQSQYSHHSGPTGVSSPIMRPHYRRPSSSCASQSAKLSAISSRRTLTGSSRNYWDIGGSVDSGSAVAPVAAGLGGWGEV